MLPTPRPAAAELRFPAMGTDVHVILVGGSPGLLARVRRRVDDLERRWSRFRPDSEVTLLNIAAGAPTAVSTDTRLLVRCAVLGWERTGGVFDPTVHDAVVAAGYDRDFPLVRCRPRLPVGDVQPAPGCAGIVVDDEAGTVTVPAGVRFDPGGIGKGLAADLVVEELLSAGAAGVCVNLGGDLRVAGQPADGPGWRVAVHDERDGTTLGTLHLVAGAVATSSTLRRRWTAGDVEQHHLIHPATGLPGGHAQAVTVVAATGWQAEVAAKAAALAHPDAHDLLLDGLAVGALILDPLTTRGWGAVEAFLTRRPRQEASM